MPKLLEPRVSLLGQVPASQSKSAWNATYIIYNNALGCNCTIP